MIGASVQSAQGSALGQIRDLAIDPQSGRVELALISLSSGAGSTGLDSTARPESATTTTTPQTARPTLDTQRPSTTTTPGTTTAERSTAGTTTGLSSSQTGKIVAVPWQLMSASSAAGAAGQIDSSSTAGRTIQSATPTLIVNADPMKLQSAPAVDHNSLIGMNQSMFSERVYSHFGLNYNDRNSAIGGAGTGISTGTGTDRNQSATPGRDRQRDLNQNRQRDQTRPQPGAGTPDTTRPKPD